MLRPIFFIVLALLLPLGAKAHGTILEYCPVESAIYKPSRNLNNEHDFSLRIEKGVEGNLLDTSYYFWIEMYNEKTKEKISALRLGNTCSPSPIECSMSAHYGQFNDLKNSEEVKSSLSFEVILADKNLMTLSDLSINNDILPHAIILPHNPVIFAENKKYHNDFKKYVNFYSEESIFPNFAGHEIWVFDHCQTDTIER